MKHLNFLCLVGLLFVCAASAAWGESIEWVRQLGTSSFDESRGVSADSLGNVYISGFTTGSLGGPFVGSSDAFISKYDAAGNLQWSRQLGASSFDGSFGVSVDGRGIVYISGVTNGSLGGPNAGGGFDDAFVVKIADFVVPEPKTLLLLCFGSLAVLWQRRAFC